MNKNLILASIVSIPLALSAASSAADSGMPSLKMGDPNCDTSRSGGGGMGSSSWAGMPGPGRPANGMMDQRMGPMAQPGARMGGMGMGNAAPWIGGTPGMMGMAPPQPQEKDGQDMSTGNGDQNLKMWGPGMGGPGMMGYGPPAGMMGQNQPGEENSTPVPNSGNAGMGMAGPPGMGDPRMMGVPMRGMPGMMAPPAGMMEQPNEENGQPMPGMMGPSASNSGMTMGMPPGMGMGPPGVGYGPWGAGPGAMMMNQGNAYPNAIENRLDNIERRLDELMRHIQNLPKN